jgi:hypothetical protein
VTDKPWVDLNLHVPASEMLAEAQRLADKFVAHRSRDSRGWKSLCLHGLSSTATQDATRYGYAEETQAPHDWTEIADACPVSVAFLKALPVKRFFRVRFMLLEPLGYILPHQDTKRPGLGPINVALNQPDGCLFKFEDEVVPFAAGKAIMLDVSRHHAVLNASDIPRYHVIVHASLRRSDPFWATRLNNT